MASGRSAQDLPGTAPRGNVNKPNWRQPRNPLLVHDQVRQGPSRWSAAEDELWQRVETLVATRQQSDYDQAVQVIRDQTTEAAHCAANDETAAHDRIAVLLAGEAAQYLRDKQRRRQPDSTDRRAAEDAAALLPPDAESVLDAEWRRVLEMLQNPATWQRVEAVAEMLVQQKTLDGEAIRRVVRGEPG